MSAVIVGTYRMLIKSFFHGLNIVSNPLVAGALLLVLTRQPGQEGYVVRERLVEQLGRLPVEINLQQAVTVLKWLFGLGFVSRTNAYFNELAENKWTLFAPTSEWVWDREIAVVTGGSAGIGEQTVIRLADKGIKVAILDISPPTHAKLKNNPRVHFIKTDVTDDKAIDSAAEEIRTKWGPPTIVINNAGIGAARLITEATPQTLAKIFGVNVFHHFYMAKAFLPDMVKRNHGHIVTIASTASFVALPGIADYATTKAGILSFHEALKQEIFHVHKAPKVLTTVIHPNWTRTALIAKQADTIEKAQGPLLTPGIVADNIVAPIFAARGRQVIIPESLKAISLLKAFPNWVQDSLRGVLSKQAAQEFLTKDIIPHT